MTESKADRRLEKLVQRIAPRSRLLRTWKLRGGISSRAIALEIAQPDGQMMKLVVRQPHAAADEFKLLQITEAAGLAAQKPLYLDESGEIFPTPYVVVEYVEGEPEFAPSNLADYLLQLATHLTRIHNIDLTNPDLSFLPNQSEAYARMLGERPDVLDESLDEGRIRDALESAWPLPQHNKPVLLHGDYWPGNILWKEGRLVAVLSGWPKMLFTFSR